MFWTSRGRAAPNIFLHVKNVGLGWIWLDCRKLPNIASGSLHRRAETVANCGFVIVLQTDAPEWHVVADAMPNMSRLILLAGLHP